MVIKQGFSPAPSPALGRGLTSSIELASDDQPPIERAGMRMPTFVAWPIHHAHAVLIPFV
jgi:hypothetical protein